MKFQSFSNQINWHKINVINEYKIMTEIKTSNFTGHNHGLRTVPDSTSWPTRGLQPTGWKC